MGTAKRKVVALLFALVAAAAFVFAFVFEGGERVSAEDSRYDLFYTDSVLSPGVTETEYYTQNTANTDQVVAYSVKVDMSQNTLVAGYGNYDTSGSWSLVNVRNQAAAVERARGVNVVAAVNGDFFNMATGEPTGTLVMNGIRVKDDATTQARTWFAIDADNKAYIGTGELPENTVEAIGGALVLIRDGAINLGEDDSYYTTKQPRTAVGVTADGDVVIVVADGRQSPYSSGYNYMELAEKMLDLGCVDAINLDGGGSTTYLAQYAGTDELTLANSPSDGREREVSSTLMVVSNSEATGVFGSASVSPVNQIYTPGSTVEFTAIGADTAGFPCEIPEGVTWRLDTDSAEMGSLTQDGVSAATLTGADGIEGVVTVEMVYQDEVVGSAKIEFRWPDSLEFSGEELSLESGIETDLGLTAQYKYREVIFKDGDFTWEVSSDNPDQENQVIGEMAGPDSNIFVTNADAVNAQGNIKVTLKANEEVFAEALVVVGQEPTVLWDFEDREGEDGSIISAEDYYDVNDPDSEFTMTLWTDDISGQINISEDYVRTGDHSLRIYYDYTQASGSKTTGLYFGTKEEYIIPNNPGKPTAIGVWVYLPQDTPNFWFRAYINGYDYDGTKKTSAQPINFTAQSADEANDLGIPYYEDTIPAGWHYFEAPLGTGDDGVISLYDGDYYAIPQTYAFRIMYVPGIGMGEKTSGYIYIDDYMFIYGANTEDVDPPSITGVDLVDEEGERTAVSAGETVTINSNYVLIDSFYTGDVTDQGKVVSEIEYNVLDGNGYSTGRTNIYIDGNGVRISAQTPESMTTRPLQVPNGTHTVLVVVADVAGNEARYSFTLVVNGDQEYDTVYLEEAEPPYLNKDYILDLFTSDLVNTESVTFEIQFGLNFELTSVTSLLENEFTVTWEKTNLIENIYEITVTRKEGATITEQDADVAIVRLIVPVPKDLTEGVDLTYQVLSSVVSFPDQTEDESKHQVINSISAQRVEQEVYAYYDFEVEPTIVNDADGAVITVLHDGVAAGAGITVYLDGVSIGETNENGQVTTTEFVATAVVKTLRAEDADGNVSYAMTLYGMTAMPTDATPIYVAAKAVTDSETQQAISWLSNPIQSGKAQVRYATKAAYDAAGGTAEVFADIAITVSGTSEVLEFDGFTTATDNYATLVNNVVLTGLTRDTEYVYQAGDGTVWSDVMTFSTTLKNGDTNFFVIGDTQGSSSTDQAAVAAIANLIGSSDIDYDFGVQTGDFVDNAGTYQQWADVLSSFSSGFGDTDMIHVMGNHEYEGNSDGSFGRALNMLPDEKYYSVTYGSVYVAVINYQYTNNAARIQEAVSWLIEDAKESDAIWKILVMHQPPYYTNPTGGNSYANTYIPAAVDEAGIDFVFSGHDHAYARTQPMTGGAVDNENGAVYIISGSTGEKSYDVILSESNHYAVATNDYTSIYLSVEVTGTTFTVTAYNVVNGEAQIFDTYTMTKDNECASSGHDYCYNDGYLTCLACGYTYKMPDDFSGMVKHESGLNMMFSNGQPQENQWVNVGDNSYYFGEGGIAADGKLTLDNGYGDMFWFEFDNGTLIGGQTGWADNNTRYFVDGVMWTGWRTIDGKMYYFLKNYEAGSDNDKLGHIAQGRVRLRTPTNPYPTYYYINFNEDGSYAHGDFHERGGTGTGNWAYTYVREPANPEDPEAVWVSYLTDTWVETEYGTFYARPSTGWLAKGDYEVDGVKYRFADTEGNPRDTGNCKLLGRYYDVTFVSEGTTVSTAEVFQNETVTAPAAPGKTGNSVVSYTFAGWFAGDVQYTEDLAVTQEMTFTARYTPVYTEIYNDMAEALAALEGAVTPAEKHEALDAATAVYKTMTETEIADAETMGMSFDLYEEMLGKLYTVTFANGETVLSTVVVYEGETVTAPESPVKTGNSVISYPFAGWFAGDLQYTETLAIEDDTAFVAAFNTVYTSEFTAMKDALDALAEVGADGSLEDRYEALSAVYALMTDFSETEVADAEAEGLSFELYEQMLADYNATADGAAEDMETAMTVAEKFLAVAAAAALLAAAAWMVFFRR